MIKKGMIVKINPDPKNVVVGEWERKNRGREVEVIHYNKLLEVATCKHPDKKGQEVHLCREEILVNELANQN
jgi:hypothetical protein